MLILLALAGLVRFLLLLFFFIFLWGFADVAD